MSQGGSAREEGAQNSSEEQDDKPHKTNDKEQQPVSEVAHQQDIENPAGAPQNQKEQPNKKQTMPTTEPKLEPFKRHYQKGLPFPLNVLKWLVAIPLVPIKILLLLIFSMLYYLFVRLAVCCCCQVPQKVGAPPMNYFSSSLVSIATRIWCRLCLFAFGFYWIECRGFSWCKSYKGIIVPNHIGYLDGFVLGYLFAPSFVSKASVGAVPLAGFLMVAIQSIFVDRSSACKRQDVKHRLLERATSKKSFPPIVVFSEGTNTNNSCVLTLQKGVFSGGHPVIPVALRVPSCVFNHSWIEWNIFKHVVWTCAQVYNRMEVTVCPEYIPSEEEKADDTLYARHVQETIAAAARLPTTTMDYRASPFVQKYLNLRRPSLTVPDIAAAGAAHGGGP